MLADHITTPGWIFIGLATGCVAVVVFFVAREKHASWAESARRRWLLLLGLVVFVVIGSFAARGRPANGVYYNGAGDIIEALIVGALVALLFLAVVGTIGYGISRTRRRDKSWPAVTFGWTAMAVTAGLLIVSAAGRAAQHEEQVSKASPNPNGSLTEREKANQVARDWSRSREPVLVAFRNHLRENPRFLKRFTAEGNVPAVRRLATRIQREFVEDQARWRLLPRPPLTDLQRVDNTAVRVVGFAAAAYADYVAGLKANLASRLVIADDKGALALLDSGDRKLNLSAGLLRRLGNRLIALDSKYGLR